MLKTITTNLETGRKVLIIGLNRAEMDVITQPGKAAFVDGMAVGSPIDLVLFHGDTEAHMLEVVAEVITPDTLISIDAALKN
jgi:hypothetical protein